jgi:PAS domain S-box-containing protein
MNLFAVSIIASISGTCLALSMYIYLYIIYRERYIGIWILSWILYFFRLLILDSTFDFWENNFNYFWLLLIAIVNAFLFTWGTHLFVKRKLNSIWLYVVLAACVVSYIAVRSDVSFEVKTLCGALPFGGMYIWTGIMIFRDIETNSLGKWITGSALILLGIHGIDFAFLRAVEWFAPGGYLIDAGLRSFIAIGTILVYFDKTRKELSDKEESYRLLAENALDVIFRYRLRPNFDFEYISPSITTITGYSPDEFYQDANLPSKIIHPEDLKIFKRMWRSVNSTVCKPLTLRLIRKHDQKTVWIEQKIVSLFSGSGELRAIEGVVRDITARKQLEHEMLRFDRLNTIGQMAANLAHEIRNPLTTVRGYLQFLSCQREYGKHKEQFTLMIEEIDRANTIIREYLSMSKNKIADLRQCQLNTIIEALLPLIKAEANASNMQIDLILDQIPLLNLDENEIRQMLLNLVRNGLEAMTTGCTMTIRTLVKDSSVILEVEDEGSGIAPHVLDKLGTPFVTTKETGTGLGLPVCYKIVNRHHAKLQIKTGSSGTIFSVCFPIDKC